MSNLTGSRVLLREFRQEDISGLRSWVNDPQVTRYMGGTFRTPQSWEQTETYLNNILTGSAGGINLVIADKASRRYLGQCAIVMIDQVARQGELSIVMAPDSMGQGYGGEAIMLLLDFAFAQMNLNRVYLKVCADNIRAVRCYEKCGFVHEGCLRQHTFVDGHYADVLLMGMLRAEFNGRKAGHSAT